MGNYSTKRQHSNASQAAAKAYSRPALKSPLPKFKKVIYLDQWSDPSVSIKSAVDAGYNIINLAFYISKGPWDMAIAFEKPCDYFRCSPPLETNEKTRQSILDYVHSKGALLFLSAGGATESPYLAQTGKEYGAMLAQNAVANGFDGVDLDLENIQQGFTFGSLNEDQLIQWLTDASVQLKNAGLYVSHAPQNPYFGQPGLDRAQQKTAFSGPLGGYSGVANRAGNAIDFFNVQFYNQGSNCGMTCETLFKTDPCFGASINEIASYGVSKTKIVLGKPMTSNDGNNYLSPTELGGVLQCGNAGATATNPALGGVMFWELGDPAQALVMSTAVQNAMQL